MALIACEECGREVSDKASACPGCGAPIGTAAAPPVEASMPEGPKRVKTSEDSAWTRNRGCADLLLILVGGGIILVLVIAALSK